LTVALVSLVFPVSAVSAGDNRTNKLEEEVSLLKEQLALAQKQINMLEAKLTSIQTDLAAGHSGKLTPEQCKLKFDREDIGPGEDRVMEEREDSTATADETALAECQVKTMKPEDKVSLIAKTLTEGFNFEGYFRSGYGVNGQGGQQVAFMAPEAGSKYRWGNETETYGELLFSKNFNTTRPNDPFFRTDIRVAYQTEENDTWDPSHDMFALREAYTEMGNFDFAPQMKFWAGQRFYQRHDVHIIDFWFLNMSGYGGGFENMRFIGPTQLDVAYIGGSNDNYEFPKIGKVAKNSFDLRIHELDLPYGEGTIWLVPSFLRGGNYTSGGVTNEYDGAAGLAAGFLHNKDEIFNIKGSKNEFMVQYGMGTGADFSPTVQNPDTKVGNRRGLRLTESFVVQANDKFAMMCDAVYQMDDNGQDSNNIRHWFSAGARPIYFFTEHLAFVVEPGMDYVHSEMSDFEDVLFKLSAGPELRFDNKFFGRPVLRAYVTYAVWGSGFKGRVGGEPYVDDTSGLAAGLQMEAWW
jgi:maltoporin